MLNPALFSSDKLDWETPAEVFMPIHEEFGFDLDVAANLHNRKVERFIGPRTDGQLEDLAGRLVRLAQRYESALAKHNAGEGPKPTGLATQRAKLYQEFCEEIGEDALTRTWEGERCWLNPPYGQALPKWIATAKHWARDGSLVACLLPSRTDTRYWHRYIWDGKNHRPQKGVEVRFLPGRIKFVGAPTSAPFPSVVVIFSPFGVDL